MKNHKGDYPKKDKRALAGAFGSDSSVYNNGRKIITDVEGIVRFNLINSNI